MNEQGKKTILYKGKEYYIKKLIKLTLDSDTKDFFTDGEFSDIKTGEIKSIKLIEEHLKEKYKDLLDEADVLGYNKKSRLKRENVDIDLNKIKELDLEDRYKNGTLTIDELKELILLKYGNGFKAYINYENFIKINQKVPDLTDSELGKFYRILTKLTYKANTLLVKSDVRSNPLTKKEISEVLNIDIKATERYLKKLKDNNIIKYTAIGEKKYFMVNPIYAFNGAIISSYTYINFKEEIENLSNIPEELKTLWEYEFINSNIEDI